MFPEQDWTDMVVAFSNAWLEALVRMATGATSRETVRFMDGPFQVALSSADSSFIEVDLIHKETVEHSVQVVLGDLLLAASGTLYWSMTPGVVAETDLAGRG